ncbi:MAG: AAA family ATPase [Methylovulum sp.]|uniref:ParA family protein n=1 Tax=Methylovulum sp. TaxID=1916980 RepID=UPI0026399BB2|nr:AAA family ATPase [Methylovulum sp.]MDD2723867.1 AAA family ATPase [Methylovulum sp.]MDD5125205.1 AAA family ATPase [Methylovulum sp.]
MKVLAVYSIKGGVGKTASAVNLAFIAARSGYRTLVWDLDPQAASSYYFNIKPKHKGSSKQLIANDGELEDLIKATEFENLDLLPADFAFRNIDLLLDTKKKPTRQLKKRLKPLADAYDFIFLDCPPNISLLSEAIFAAADVLLSPIIPTTLSLRTLQQLQSFMLSHELEALPLLAFFSMVDRRKKMHKEMMQHLLDTFPGTLATAIPYASDIERMGLECKPLAAFIKNSPSTIAYNELWQEILARITVND